MSSLDILCVLSNLAIKWNWKFIWADTPYFGTTLLSPSFNLKPNFLTFTNYTSAIALLICVLMHNYFTCTYFILKVNKKHIFCYKIVANSNNMLCSLCIPSKIAVVLAQCMLFVKKYFRNQTQSTKKEYHFGTTGHIFGSDIVLFIHPMRK